MTYMREVIFCNVVEKLVRVGGTCVLLNNADN